MTAGATCRCWALSASTRSRSSTWSAAVLRPGNAPAVAGASGILRRLLARTRRHFPGARILVRLDGGFAHPRLLDWLGRQPGVDYVVAMAKNAVLKRKAKPAMRLARKLSRQSGETEHVYSEASYAAQTWSHARRIILKAEVVRADDKDPRDNPRFLVTNLKQSPQWGAGGIPVGGPKGSPGHAPFISVPPDNAKSPQVDPPETPAANIHLGAWRWPRQGYASRPSALCHGQEDVPEASWRTRAGGRPDHGCPAILCRTISPRLQL